MISKFMIFFGDKNNTTTITLVYHNDKIIISNKIFIIFHTVIIHVMESLTCSFN